MTKLKTWWEKTKWNYRRRISKVPLWSWECEQYLRSDECSSRLKFWDDIIQQKIKKETKKSLDK